MKINTHNIHVQNGKRCLSPNKNNKTTSSTKRSKTSEGYVNKILVLQRENLDLQKLVLQEIASIKSSQANVSTPETDGKGGLSFVKTEVMPEIINNFSTFEMFFTQGKNNMFDFKEGRFRLQSKSKSPLITEKDADKIAMITYHYLQQLRNSATKELKLPVAGKDINAKTEFEETLKKYLPAFEKASKQVISSENG